MPGSGLPAYRQRGLVAPPGGGGGRTGVGDGPAGCAGRGAGADRGKPEFTPGRPAWATRTSRWTATAATTSSTTCSISTTTRPPTSCPGRRRSPRGQRRTCRSFNLDLDGLTVRSIKVNGRSADWSRDGGELTVTPSAGLPDQQPLHHRRDLRRRARDALTTIGVSGFIHTDDGALVARPACTSRRPGSRSTTIRATRRRTPSSSPLPQGLEVVANGVLQKSRTRHGWTTWTWDAKEPMASYLAMMADR